MVSSGTQEGRPGRSDREATKNPSGEGSHTTDCSVGAVSSPMIGLALAPWVAFLGCRALRRARTLRAARDTFPFALCLCELSALLGSDRTEPRTYTHNIGTPPVPVKAKSAVFDENLMPKRLAQSTGYASCSRASRAPPTGPNATLGVSPRPGQGTRPRPVGTAVRPGGGHASGFVGEVRGSNGGEGGVGSAGRAQWAGDWGESRRTVRQSRQDARGSMQPNGG